MESDHSAFTAANWNWLWLTLFVVLAAVHLTCVSSEIGGNLGGDSVIYVLLGKALATGRGYVDLYLPGHPPHLKYPFLFPALIAACHLVFSHPLAPLHAVLAMLNALAAVLLGRWASRRLDCAPLGLALGLTAGTLPLVYLQSLHLLSEVPFMALVFGSFLLLPGESEGPASRVRLVGLWLLVTAAYFTRSAGVVLMAAAVFDGWRSRSRVRLAGREIPAWPLLALGFVLPVLAWAARNHFAGESTPYLGQFLAANPYEGDWSAVGPGDFLRRVGSNFSFYLQVLAEGVFSPAWAWRLRGARGIIGILVLIGMVREMRRGPRGPEIFSAGFILMILVWPYQEKRLLLPLLPPALYYLVRAGSWPFSLTGGELWSRRASGAALAALILVQSGLTAELVSERFRDRREPAESVFITGYGEWKDHVINFADYNMNGKRNEGFSWSTTAAFTDYLIACSLPRDLTPPDAVVMARKPMLVYWYSGRESLGLPSVNDPREFMTYCRRHRVGYLIDSVFERDLEPVVRQLEAESPPGITVAADIKRTGTRLLKINLPGEAAPPGRFASGDATGQDQGQP